MVPAGLRTHRDLAEAMGMRVIYYDHTDKLRRGNVEPTDTLEELLSTSDVVTLHVPATPATRNMIDAVFARSLGGDVTDRDAVMAAYEAHNAAVRSEIPPERLFEYQPGDGWAPLCAALGVPEPDEPFPHTNTREECRERLGLDDPT